MKKDRFGQLNDFQTGREEIKIPLLYREGECVNLLENPTFMAAKVVTFNDRSKVLGHLFNTIY